jgi:hypothetical protein
MSTAQVLDQTFHVYRNHFFLLAGIGVLLPALLLLLQLAFVPLGYPPRSGSAARAPFLFWTVFLEYWFNWILLYVMGHALTGAATTYAISRLHLGEPVTIVESYRKTLPRFWTVLRIALNIYARLLGSGILTYIACVLALGVIAVPAWTGPAGRAVLGVLAIILGIATGLAGIFWMLYLYCKYCLAIPACIIEGLPARPALRRSRFLAGESVRRITLVYLLMAVLGLVLSTVLRLPGEFYTLYFRGNVVLTTVLYSLGSFIAGALAGPIATIAIALVYYDQRVRKEAFDLQMMMDSIAQSAPGPAKPDVAQASDQQPEAQPGQAVPAEPG